MGEIINNITLNDYSLLSSEDKEFYNELMRSIKPVEILRGKKEYNPIKEDFWFLKWKEIEALRKDLKSSNLEGVLTIAYGIEPTELNEISITNIIGCYKWAEKKLIEIAEVEKNQFPESKPTQAQINAGIANFEIYDYYNQLDELTLGDILKEEKIMKLPYWKVFRKICRNRTKSDYNEALLKQK